MSLDKKNKSQETASKKPIKKVTIPQKSKKTKPKSKPINSNNADEIISNLDFKLNHLQIEEKKRTYRDISHLGTIAEEYLSSFALIGYSLQDEKVVMLNMPSPKDEAALVDLLRATFVDLASNRP